MLNKRPCEDEDSYKVVSKHPRQSECVNELASVVDIVPLRNAPKKSFSDNEGQSSFNKCQVEGRISSDVISDVSKQTKESENGVSDSISHYLWVNNSIIEADERLETAAHLSFFPEYFDHGDRLRVLLQSDDIYVSPVDHPPQKLVPIGPEHQAYVPEWDQQGTNFSDHQIDPQTEVLHGSGLHLMVNADIEKMGTCVIPMPKTEVSLNYCSQDGAGRNECKCLDGSSIICVSLHVMEAREKLRENIGPKLFEELGFCDMGEEVAKQWTEEEEQIFHEVVLANPASVGKNFWDHLLMALPSRTKKGLVSYYFNVFMLRKRAEQNRLDPLNIDSDNDEWAKNELGLLEDEDDSVVESPIDQNVSAYHQEEKLEDCHEHLEDENELDVCENGADGACRVGTDEEDGGDIVDGSQAYIKDLPGNYGDIEIDRLGKISSNNKEDSDVQDDSCTSYEYQQDRIDLCCPLDDGNLRTDARDCSVG